MSDKNPEHLDLLGDPWRPLKDQRGRKSHRWTKEVAENVAILSATELNQDQIADRIGLDPKTLRKYYSRELENGPVLAQARVDEVMYKEALSGKVGAARYIRESFGNAKLKRAMRTAKHDKPSVPKQGLKEQRRDSAERVEGLYARREPPPPRVQ